MSLFARLRRDAVRGWVDLPGTEHEGPLLSSAFLNRLESLSLRVGRHGTTGFAGEHPSTRKAHSVEFADYRDYRPGDDFRLIDWNVYARLGQLTLRLTEAAEATTLHLLLDCSGSMAYGIPSKFRTMQRLAAALGCMALARYDSVALGLLRGENAQALPRLRGKGETARFLSVLESLRPQGALDLAAAVRSYCTVPRRGVGVLVSDLLTPHGVPEAVAALRKIGLEPAVFQLLAREECRPKLDGPVQLVDCETGSTVMAAINAAALQAYAEHFATWTAEIEATCSTQRAAFIRICTDQPLEEVLISALRGGMVQ
jgi:uncharacterized protein (DUF58 family)